MKSYTLGNVSKWKVQYIIRIPFTSFSYNIQKPLQELVSVCESSQVFNWPPIIECNIAQQFDGKVFILNFFQNSVFFILTSSIKCYKFIMHWNGLQPPPTLQMSADIPGAPPEIGISESDQLEIKLMHCRLLTLFILELLRLSGS